MRGSLTKPLLGAPSHASPDHAVGVVADKSLAQDVKDHSYCSQPIPISSRGGWPSLSHSSLHHAARERECSNPSLRQPLLSCTTSNQLQLGLGAWLPKGYAKLTGGDTDSPTAAASSTLYQAPVFQPCLHTSRNATQRQLPCEAAATAQPDESTAQYKNNVQPRWLNDECTVEACYAADRPGPAAVPRQSCTAWLSVPTAEQLSVRVAGQCSMDTFRGHIEDSAVLLCEAEHAGGTLPEVPHTEATSQQQGGADATRPATPGITRPRRLWSLSRLWSIRRLRTSSCEADSCGNSTTSRVDTAGANLTATPPAPLSTTSYPASILPSAPPSVIVADDVAEAVDSSTAAVTAAALHAQPVTETWQAAQPSTVHPNSADTSNVQPDQHIWRPPRLLDSSVVLTRRTEPVADAEHLCSAAAQHRTLHCSHDIYRMYPSSAAAATQAMQLQQGQASMFLGAVGGSMGPAGPCDGMWLELRDSMGWWLSVCLCAQMLLMWYLSGGLMTRNSAGALLVALLSGGNMLGLWGSLLYLWCTPLQLPAPAPACHGNTSHISPPPVNCNQRMQGACESWWGLDPRVPSLQPASTAGNDPSAHRSQSQDDRHRFWSWWRRRVPRHGVSVTAEQGPQQPHSMWRLALPRPSGTSSCLPLSWLATLVWTLAVAATLGSLVSLLIGLGLFLVVDMVQDQATRDRWGGGWGLGMYLVAPPPCVGAFSAACAWKVHRLLQALARQRQAAAAQLQLPSAV